jgi:F-type H+-transporting ATPase subunit alpha
MNVFEQVISLFAATKGYFDKVPVNMIGEIEKDLIDFIKSKHEDLFNQLLNEKTLSDDINSKLGEAITSFLATKQF